MQKRPKHETKNTRLLKPLTCCYIYETRNANRTVVGVSPEMWCSRRL